MAKVNPKEVARAMGENAVAFVKNPKAQSRRAYEVATGLANNAIAEVRPLSPLKPENRPGVPAEALRNGGMVKVGKGSTPYKCK